MKSTGKIWIFFDSQTQKQTKPMSTVQAQMTLLALKIKDPSRYHIWTPGWTEWIPLDRFIASDQRHFVIAPAPKPRTTEDDKSAKMDVDALDQDVTKILYPDHSAHSQPSYTNVIDERQAGPTAKVDYGYYYEDFRADQIDPNAQSTFKIKTGEKPKSGRDRRVGERHNFKIEVILISKNGRTFRTFSQNISVGGTLLEDEIPKDFINNRFDLILVNKFDRNGSGGRLHFQGRIVGDFANPRRLMFMETDVHNIRRLEAMLKAYQEQHLHAMKKKSG